MTSEIISLHDIPIELIVNFVVDSVEVYVALLVFRPFALWTLRPLFLFGDSMNDYLVQKGIKVDLIDDRNFRETYLKIGGELKLHSFFDLSSKIVFKNGCEHFAWHKKNVLHREGFDAQGNPRPAISGRIFHIWYKNGKKHSYLNSRGELMPAELSPCREHWYKDDLLHRDNGLPAVTDFDIPYNFENGEYCGPEYILVRGRIFEVKSGLISNKTEFTYEDLFISLRNNGKFWSRRDGITIYCKTMTD